VHYSSSKSDKHQGDYYIYLMVGVNANHFMNHHRTCISLALFLWSFLSSQRKKETTFWQQGVELLSQIQPDKTMEHLTHFANKQGPSIKNCRISKVGEVFLEFSAPC
jgi:hypothetical protein